MLAQPAALCNAIRGRARLACPAEAAFPATVAAPEVNEVIEANRMLVLSGDDLALG